MVDELLSVRPGFSWGDGFKHGILFRVYQPHSIRDRDAQGLVCCLRYWQVPFSQVGELLGCGKPRISSGSVWENTCRVFSSEIFFVGGLPHAKYEGAAVTYAIFDRSAVLTMFG